MSRPQKMHKPLKGTFTDLINAVADGKGVKKPKRATPSSEVVKASQPPTKK